MADFFNIKSKKVLVYKDLTVNSGVINLKKKVKIQYLKKTATFALQKDTVNGKEFSDC